MNKPKCMLTVDVEALPKRAASDCVDTLIYGRFGKSEYGIGRMMDIADRHGVKMSFFVDFAECELYGDEIIDVARYIKERGHDLQVHCHTDFLQNKICFESEKGNYGSWVNDKAVCEKVVDYLTEKYRSAVGGQPLAYRGGAYRIGKALLEALEEKGYAADLSYNHIRPDIRPESKQFKFQNSIIELPVSLLQNGKPLNFNYPELMPQAKADFAEMINKYKAWFSSFYNYYGSDAVATLMLHSWSLQYDESYACSTGLYDKPNALSADFFDEWLCKMKENIDFVTVTQAVAGVQKDSLKTVDFGSIFDVVSPFSEENLHRTVQYIKKKSNGRKVAVWGRGWVESTAFQKADFQNELDIEFYISNDAERASVWRKKPVYRFGDVSLSPKKNFVFVAAQGSFSEIRDTLNSLGFEKGEDWCDVCDIVPIESETSEDKKILPLTCPICGGNEFEVFNKSSYSTAYGVRLCSKCHSLERSRTLARLLNENVNIELKDKKILHISPSMPEKAYFKNVGATATTLDICPECKADITADICNMPEVDGNEFDLVLACCVLNHVYDDGKALSEIKRVMKKGGRALLWVTGSGSLKNIYFDDPTQWYGRETFDKYKVGTFRYYGETDFTKLLKEHFDVVNCYEKFDDVTATQSKWYECIK